MATKVGKILGVSLLVDGESATRIARLSFTMPAFTASDTGMVDAQTAIETRQRNHKAVTLRGACRGPEGRGARVDYFASSLAVSGGAVTFRMTDQEGTPIDSPGGGAESVGSNSGDAPMSVLIVFDGT